MKYQFVNDHRWLKDRLRLRLLEESNPESRTSGKPVKTKKFT